MQTTADCRAVQPNDLVYHCCPIVSTPYALPARVTSATRWSVKAQVLTREDTPRSYDADTGRIFGYAGNPSSGGFLSATLPVGFKLLRADLIRCLHCGAQCDADAICTLCGEPVLECAA